MKLLDFILLVLVIVLMPFAGSYVYSEWYDYDHDVSGLIDED